MNHDRQFEEKRFVEEVGIVFEQTGLPKMAGRILGQLLVADPPYQSIGELAKELMASKGSISAMNRLLIGHGLVERFSLPGIRHDYFRIRPDACHHMIRRGLEDEVKMIRQLAERGLELLADKVPPTRKWLEDMLDVYVFLEKELPALVERWEQEHNKAKVR
ncbi:GbsR/MarR family transcriptional regulator [Chloroflexota bacterium]